MALHFTSMLQRGSTGPDVAELQRILTKLGWPLEVDGDFGPKTDAAVRAFQRSHGLEADGQVGPQTTAALDAALGGQPAPAPAPPAPPPPPAGLAGEIARVAEVEFARWHPGGRALRETDPEAGALLQEYYRVGIGRDVTPQQLQNPAFQQSNPWSAVFVSYVMRIAGAGDAFAYSPLHATYVRAAKQNRLSGNGNPFWAYPVGSIVPQPGDLVCATHAHDTYDSFGTNLHCDVVTAAAPGSLRVVGGNWSDGVNAHAVRTGADGKVTEPGIFAVVTPRGPAGQA